MQYALVAMGYSEVLGLATANVVWTTQTAMIITTGGIGYFFLMAAGLRKQPQATDNPA